MTPYKVLTRDGSPTLYSERYRQHYHNVSGALTESRHVFFDRTGILDALSAHRNFTICEVGFGTGFHVQLLDHLHREAGSQSQIRYFSVEKHPPGSDLIRQLGYSDSLIRFADELAQSRPGSELQIELPSITVRVFRGDFFDWDIIQSGIAPVDFFLFDAFSPEVNPELWSPAAFSKLIAVADGDAMLGTYCSATRARAAMVLSGWHVARAEGPPGKREMTLASPGIAPLEGYKRVNEERLRERFQGLW